jgi:hypothetical protein
MSTGAVTSRTKRGTARTLLEPVEGGRDVGIEVGNGCCLRIALTSSLALIVEFEDSSRWFDPVVDLGGCNQKAVACQANAPAQGRIGELEDVGIENDRRTRTGAAGRGDESPHRQIPDRNVDVLLRDHCHEWNRCKSGWLPGLITIVMPVLATATIPTTVTLATTHVITDSCGSSLVWRADR